MKEYIERDKVLGALPPKCGTGDVYALAHNTCRNGIRNLIKNIPAADVVEVSCRCKDCKHWKHFDHLGCTDFGKVCGLANYMIGANGYCLYGERRDSDEGVH